MAIDRFRDDHYFLSNMFPVRGGIELGGGIRVPTSEHGYYLQKFPDPADQAQILAVEDGREAKKVADRLEAQGKPITENWDEVKVEAMKRVLERKFAAGTRMAYLLLQTGEEELIEGNPWGDNFWGVSPPGNPEGLNWLGRILGETRTALRAQKFKK